MSTLGVGCFKAQLRRLEPKALLWGSRARWPRRLVDSPRAPSWKGGDARAICLRSATEAGNKPSSVRLRWKRKAAATISYRGHRSGRGFCNFVASARGHSAGHGFNDFVAGVPCLIRKSFARKTTGTDLSQGPLMLHLLSRIFAEWQPNGQIS